MKTQALIGELKHAEDEYKSQCADTLTRFFEAVFEDYPDLDAILVQGYTPGFNDGDPCVHDMNVHVAGDDYEGFAEALGYSCFEDHLKLMRPDPNKKLGGSDWSTKDGGHAYAIVQGVHSLSDALEQAFDTNWQILWYRGLDGKVHRTDVESYDCGN